MNGRQALLLVPAFGLALAINAVLFGIAALLTGERGRPQDMSAPVAVNLVPPPPPELPQQEDRRPPPRKPEPRRRLDFQPELSPLQLGRIQGPAVVVDVGLAPLDASLSVGGIVFTEAELDDRPRSIARPTEYPYRAERRGLEGEVRVKLLVRSDGTVGSVEILAADPPGVFEDAVRRGAMNWRFEPGRIAGVPVDTWVITSVSFQVDR